MLDSECTRTDKKNHVLILRCLWPGKERYHIISPKFLVFMTSDSEKEHSSVSITNGNWLSAKERVQKAEMCYVS